LDPQAVFCANPACADRGAAGKGNVKVHSHKERRFRCWTCGKTFSASTGTPFYRLHKDQGSFLCVVTLLAHGCPLPAIVAAFGLDERTVASWQSKAGSHCQAVQRHHLGSHKLDLQHVQADELYAKRQGGRSWMAMAMAVPSRLWLGGVVSPVRDRDLIQKLVDLVRLAWLPGTALLICVDGLSSYVWAFWVASREKVRTGRRGRPPYRLPEGIWLAQLIKSYSGRRLSDVVRRVLWGSQEQVVRQLEGTKTGRQINTSYLERLNATFRASLAGLTRRGRRLVKDEEVLEEGMYLVGCTYNFCKPHRSLRVQQKRGKKWLQRTPAMAAGWTDHLWSIRELLEFRPVSLLHG
jgi:transposase-like protein